MTDPDELLGKTLAAPVARNQMLTLLATTTAGHRSSGSRHRAAATRRCSAGGATATGRCGGRPCGQVGSRTGGGHSSRCARRHRPGGSTGPGRSRCRRRAGTSRCGWPDSNRSRSSGGRRDPQHHLALSRSSSSVRLGQSASSRRQRLWLAAILKSRRTNHSNTSFECPVTIDLETSAERPGVTRFVGKR